MNERTSYEILISEKAEQCSVPDMADNIWSAIDSGLNASPANMNNNDQGQLNASSHAGKSLNWWKLSLFGTAGCIAIATIVLLSLPKDSSNAKKNNNIQPEHQTAPVQPPADSLHLNPVEIKKTTPPHTPTDKNTPIVVPDSTLIKKDSVNNMSTIKAPIVDSVVTSPQKLPDSSATLPNIKKPHGVRGISPDDYKITPYKKDSTNGKQ